MNNNNITASPTRYIFYFAEDLLPPCFTSSFWLAMSNQAAGTAAKM